MARHEKSRAGVDASVSAAFLSDIHLGSRTFLRPQWQKLVEWFHNDPIAQTVKYFVLSGDGVDGIGIYPGQEKELMITNLFDQYSELAKLLEVLPDHIEVMLLPGNHDAVRPAEPQPALDPEVQTDYNNTTFVGNPCDFSLHGVRILSYHGKSIDDFVAQLRSVSYAKPETAMRAMLERRHLAPSWGGKTPLSPEPEDRLVIPVIPDIFVTGHVHGHFVGEHKGVTMVQSSTWQNQTSYQRMLGFQPKPCMLTVINLHTHASTTIPFA
jgi:DNA polymerase II small subunit